MAEQTAQCGTCKADIVVTPETLTDDGKFYCTGTCLGKALKYRKQREQGSGAGYAMSPGSDAGQTSG